MLEMMKRHPKVFVAGENFFKRNDLSDPERASNDVEPTANVTSDVTFRGAQENPYQSPRELVTVFHYVAPEDVPSTAAHFLECSSPAMRVVLPPRITGLLQLFPDLFSCIETTPGTFTLRKVIAGSDAAGGTQEMLEDRMTEQEAVASVASLIPTRGVEITQLSVWLSMSLKRSVTALFGKLETLLDTHPAVFRVIESGGIKTVFVTTRK